MQIAIDARFYGPLGKGLGRYVQKLITHLEQLPHDHKFTVLLREENWNAYTPSDSRFHKLLADIPWYSVAEQVRLPRILRAGNFDLVHFPHYNVPLLYRRPYVVTIHDLIVSRYPTVRATTLNPLLYRIKHAAYAAVIRSAIQHARHVLTVSAFSRSVIEQTYRIPADRITVTYEAAEPLIATTTDTTEERRRARAIAPYLLYVGNAYPHKNLEGLLRAFVQVQRSVHPLKLVLVGREDYFYARLRRLAQTLGCDANTIFFGAATDAELTALYAQAAVYVFPSFEEGFGLPPLEAMLAGVPVASSNWSCLPEVLGTAAEYFDPKKPDAIANAIRRLLTDQQRREELIRRGHEQAQKYHWEDLAKSTLDVYAKAYRSP